MREMLIRGGTIVDTINNTLIKADLYIKNGRIESIGKDLSYTPETILDATNQYIAPGFIDLHVHLRQPGQTHKETIATGALAGASGGVTTMLCMPNTAPVIDNVETLEFVLDKANETNVNILPVSAITKGLQGEELVDFKDMQNHGAIGFSDDGVPVATASLMRSAMLKTKEIGSLIFAHCEDLSLANKGIINAGVVSKELGVHGIPNATEDIGTAREIALCADTGARVHICHVSTKASVNMVRIAKQQGVPVTCETAPHYFTFTEEELLKKDANFRMNPPLRTREDKRAVLEGIKDGTIDAIATDHAPHSKEEKAEFFLAPNGVVGMATSFAVVHTKLVESGEITIFDLVRLMAETPATIIGRASGNILVGRNADLVLFDPKEKWIIDEQTYLGKSRNTPFIGMALIGKVKTTICNGEIVFKDK